jgi:conjugative transfer signal peptidase TraF
MTWGARIAGASLGICGLVVTAGAAGLRYNGTASMPRGVWLEDSALSHAFRAGDVIMVCEPAKWIEPYVAPGHCPSRLEPLLKPIVAVAGDTVTVSTAGIAVNGVMLPHSAPMANDGAGRPLHAWPAGTYAVGDWQVWLVSPRPDSLDGRYLGPTATVDIEGVAHPVLVWR